MLPRVNHQPGAGVPAFIAFLIFEDDVDLQIGRRSTERVRLGYMARLPVDTQVVPASCVDHPYDVPLVDRRGIDVIVECQSGARADTVVPVAVDIRCVRSVQLNLDVSPADRLVDVAQIGELERVFAVPCVAAAGRR